MTSLASEPHQPAALEKDVSVQPELKSDDLDKKATKGYSDADAAMKAFEGLNGQVLELTEEKNKELLRKIDWHLMPVSLRHDTCFQ
jgi:ACS family allantoate permease-like MFS transporter